MRAIIRVSQIAVIVACFTLATTPFARADDFDKCMQGFDRYKSNLAELEDARAQWAKMPKDANPALDRACEKIAPETGHAACEAFLQSGGAKGAQLTSAQKANRILEALYSECRSQ